MGFQLKNRKGEIENKCYCLNFLWNWNLVSVITFFIYDLTCAKVVTFGKRMFNSVIIKCYGIMMLASLTFYGC